MARKEDTVALLPQMEKASAWLSADPDRKVKEACAKFGVPYGTFWMVHERNTLIARKVKIHTSAEMAAMGEGQIGALVEKYRKAGDSWGTIMAKFGDSKFGTPEPTIRKAWVNRTNLHAEGTRVGHGGRFLGGVEFHEVLYRGINLQGEDAKRAGTTDDKDAKLLSDTVAKVLAARNEGKAAKVAKPRKPRKVTAKKTEAAA